MSARIEGRYCFSSVCEYCIYWTSGGSAASLLFGSVGGSDVGWEDMVIMIVFVVLGEGRRGEGRLK